MTELLDFDLALLEALLEGRPTWGTDAPPLPLWDRDVQREPLRLVGFDEAGRGALAGPVAVACVHFDFESAGRISQIERSRLTEVLRGLDDSKRVAHRGREALFDAITATATWGLGVAAPSEIDRWGIVHACRLAARRALGKLNFGPTVVLFDRGLSLVEHRAHATIPELELTHGDARSLHIAAASIVAKVGRDAIMCRLDRRFPGYGLAEHKGYGTVAHREAIHCLGLSLVHRRSFCTRMEVAESQSR